MFAVEIDFRDGISPPETVLLRRSSAILGGSERSHLIIEGAGSSVTEIQLLRGPGRSFYTIPLTGSANVKSSFSKQIHYGDANLVFGNYKLNITSLDFDLCLRKDELPDLSAARVIRGALTNHVIEFPALCLLGENPALVSFYSKQDIVVGRSPFCPLRLDVPDISSEHSRFGLDNQEFWVEDLGSTNGTVVNGEKISGRHYLKAGEKVHIGSSAIIVPVQSNDDLVNIEAVAVNIKDSNLPYPCLYTNSNLIKPRRLALTLGVTFSIGRDPTCDVWVNAPHISREHVLLTLEQEGVVKIVDVSSNGTFVKGKKLKSNIENRFSGPTAIELDLCSGVVLDILFNSETKEVGNKESEGFKAPTKSNNKNKLNEENYNKLPASDLLEAKTAEVETGNPVQLSKSQRLNDFEKYQLEQSGKVNLEEIFEDEEEFNLLAAKLEEERILKTREGEYRVVFFIFILVLLIVSICVLIFTSDLYF